MPKSGEAVLEGRGERDSMKGRGEPRNEAGTNNHKERKKTKVMWVGVSPPFFFFLIVLLSLTDLGLGRAANRAADCE